MERPARWALTITAIGVAASIISIVTFVTGMTSARQMLKTFGRQFSSSTPSLDRKAAETRNADTNEQVSPLVASALARLEVGQNVDYLIQTLGPPIVTRRQTPQLPIGASHLNFELIYYRFSFRESCDVQLLANPNHAVTAFVIHGCGYSFPGSDWKVGETTLSQLGDSEHQLVGGDAKFPAYVEKHYFGRPGHYHYYFFASRWPGLPLDVSSIPDINRSSAIINAVAVVESPHELDASEEERWDEYISEIVGVHVSRFEGL